MNKNDIIKNNYEFQRIIKNNKAYKYKGIILYIDRNKNYKYKFGFSVGKKIGNAVVRNKIKRQLRSIVSKHDYNDGFNCVILVTSNILNMNYHEIKESLQKMFKKLNLLEGEKYEEE